MNNKKNDKVNLKNQEESCFICGISYSEAKTKNVKFISIQHDSEEIILCGNCIHELSNCLDGNKINLNNEDFAPFMTDEDFNKKIKDSWNIGKKELNNNLDDDILNNKLNYKDTSPQKIKEYLDKYIIGQEIAKQNISVAYYNHLKRISIKDKNLVRKSNILLAGPTGSGKTLIASKLADMAHVPFVVADATTFTKKGYVGDDVESMLNQLIYKANGNIQLAQKGIVYIDEFDKIAAHEVDNLSGTDPSGKSVQQALLKMLDGSKVKLGNSLGEQSLSFDTSNILFICGGAFSGIEEIYKRRTIKENEIGFGTRIDSKKQNEKNDMFVHLETSDFISYGIIPELMGRLPVIVPLNKLSKNDLIKVLTEPKDSICKEYEYLFKMDNINLNFDKEALNFIAEEANKRKVGARGLRGMLEKTLNSLMFTIPTEKNIAELTITKDFIKNNNIKNLIISKNNYKKTKQNS